MKRSIFTAMAVLGLVLVSSNPAEAQLVNFPNYAVPSGAPASTVFATVGRGLNDNSGKENAYGLGYVRTGIADRVGVVVGAGLIDFDPDSEYTFGGAVGVDLLPADGSAQVSVQGGIGYFSPTDNFSQTNFPIGVALKTAIPSESANIGLWVMPRLDIMRTSFLDVSDTNTEFGASAGIGVTTSSGFGVHAAVDILAIEDNNVLTGGAGIHYTLP